MDFNSGKDLVEFVAKALVNNPEQVRVAEKSSEQTTILELSVAKEDLGLVIGREGRIANALRTLLRSLSAKTDRSLLLEIFD